jgi:hypothetical protein
MAWTTIFTATGGDTITAATFNAQVRDNLLETEAARSFFAGNHMISFGANSIRPKSCFRDSQLEEGITTGTSFGNLFQKPNGDYELWGPGVTLTTGTTAVAFYSARMGNSVSSGFASISVAVEDSSGTEYIAASDQWAMQQDGLSASREAKYGVSHKFTGLTAGENTFMMKYRVGAGGGTGSFSNREMFVIAL